MKVSYNWLESYFERSFWNRGLPKPEKVAELFNLHFAEVEGMERVGGDTVLDIKILADRNHYALSHRGVARELGAILGKHIERRVRKDAPAAADVADVKVLVEEPKLCRRYVARLIKGVTVSDSSKDIRAKLEAIGARAINSVVDVTNYVMFDIGQPLHAFDAAKIAGEIHVRLAKEGEKIVILDGREISLKSSDLVIADGIGPIAIAGVKGGKRAEVTKETKNIIIESANFDPVSVRRTSTRHNLRNDSSKRFENEITPFLAYEAMDRVTKLICAMAPESKVGPVTDIYQHPVNEWTIETTARELSSVVGADLGAKEITRILESLDMRVAADGEKLLVTPPFERLDVVIPEDLADEVGRLYGYEKIKSKELPQIPSVPADKTFYWAEKAKNILVELGFSETLLYTLVPKGYFEVSYPLASDKSALREKIAPKLAESLIVNSRNADLLGLETVKIFEIGKVFPASGEKTHIAIGVSQVKKKKGVTSESVLKETVASLESKLGVKIEGKIEIGPYGALIEADFDSLISCVPAQTGIQDLGFIALPKDKRYKPFSPYPFITRDMALFVPSGTSESEVSGVIRDSAVKAALIRTTDGQAGNLLVKGPDLFDKFEKDGKVSYAFRMIFQSFEKTLSDDEANAFMTKIYAAVKEKGWEVR